MLYCRCQENTNERQTDNHGEMNHLQQQWKQYFLVQQVSCHAAARNFGIPEATLRRRLKTPLITTNPPLRQAPALGAENEQRLKEHLVSTGSRGFGLTRLDVRRLAFQFAKRNNISNQHFNDQESGMAGDEWLNGFLKRNSDLSI